MDAFLKAFTVRTIGCFAAIVGGVLWWNIYNIINRWNVTSGRAAVVASPGHYLPWIIQPVTVWIYLGGFAVLLAIPWIVIADLRTFRTTLAQYAAAGAVCLLMYVAFPLRIERPVLSGVSVNERALLRVYGGDYPANCFPSSHVVFALMGAAVVIESACPTWAKGSVALLAALVSISTLTTGQHYVIDVLGGICVVVAIKVISVWLVRGSLVHSSV